jgi:hypothetical protein
MKKVKGFILKKAYPGSGDVGRFVYFTTGEFLSWPEYWQPVFEMSELDNIKVELEKALQQVVSIINSLSKNQK